MKRLPGMGLRRARTRAGIWEADSAGRALRPHFPVARVRAGPAHDVNGIDSSTHAIYVIRAQAEIDRSKVKPLISADIEDKMVNKYSK